MPCWSEMKARWPCWPGKSTRNLLYAGDQLVHGLVHRHFLVDHAIHRFGPDVLVVENGEFVVLGELKRDRAARILVVDRFAVAVLGPEWPCLRSLRHRVPTAERALYVRREVLLLHQE